MHRKKLRLAIEEQRRPELCRYPAISQLGHTWVAAEWLPDLGLAQVVINYFILNENNRFAIRNNTRQKRFFIMYFFLTK